MLWCLIRYMRAVSFIYATDGRVMHLLSLHEESAPKDHVSVTCSCVIRKWSMGKFLSHLHVFVASQPVNLIRLCYRIDCDSQSFMVGGLHACSRSEMWKISVSFYHCDQAKGLTAFVRWSMNFTRANTKAFLTYIHPTFWSQHSLSSLFNSHSNLAPGLRISGAIPLLRFMPSWRGQGQYYFLNHLFSPTASTDWRF